MPEGPLFILFMFSPLPDLLSQVPVYYPNGIILALRIFSYYLKSATLLKSQSVAAQTAKNAIFLVWTDFLPCVG